VPSLLLKPEATLDELLSIPSSSVLAEAERSASDRVWDVIELAVPEQVWADFPKQTSERRQQIASVFPGHELDKLTRDEFQTDLEPADLALERVYECLGLDDVVGVHSRENPFMRLHSILPLQTVI